MFLSIVIGFFAKQYTKFKYQQIYVLCNIPNLTLNFFLLSGGTVDTAVHEVREDHTLAEVYRACGGDWGRHHCG